MVATAACLQVRRRAGLRQVGSLDCAVEGDGWRSPVAVWGDSEGFAAAVGSGAADDVV